MTIEATCMCEPCEEIGHNDFGKPRTTTCIYHNLVDYVCICWIPPHFW